MTLPSGYVWIGNTVSLDINNAACRKRAPRTKSLMILGCVKDMTLPKFHGAKQVAPRACAKPRNGQRRLKFAQPEIYLGKLIKAKQLFVDLCAAKIAHELVYDNETNL